MDHPKWQPSPDRVARSPLTAFRARVERQTATSVPDYRALHDWSVRDLPSFWNEVWDACGIIGNKGREVLRHADRFPGATFFPDGHLNFAENLLRRDDDEPAILAVDERGESRRLTCRQLRRAVAEAAAVLRDAGVVAGDRVCAVVSNVPEAVIGALATASIGAVWSSCSPDFGADGIVDRFGQVAPGVLIAVGGYAYGGKVFSCEEKIRAVVERVPSIHTAVVIPFAPVSWSTEPVRPSGRAEVALQDWRRLMAVHLDASLEFPRFPFNHPLYILYSSGTTGAPKCIVHGAGGTLLEHLKELHLHSEISAGDRVFYYTTCGWMMWNWLVTALACEATLVLYDGSPFWPDPLRLFRVAAEARATFFGGSAKFYDALRKADVHPADACDLRAVRTVASTGSPLVAESFDFIYDRIAPAAHLESISGGTDIVGCFVMGDPTSPVWRGEIQAAGLGMDIQVFDPSGQPMEEGPGELVCATPFPSMPLGFWNDADGRKYRDAYFARFPGVWHHGDWIRRTAHSGFVIVGRSDATLNPGGVRIGTAEIYRQVEQIPDVLESLAVGQDWEGDVRIVLFVRLVPGRTLDDELRRRIVTQIKTHTSPRHVPARILEVPDIPRTRSGKIVELAVRDVIHGRPVVNAEALANPEALDAFRHRRELQQ